MLLSASAAVDAGLIGIDLGPGPANAPSGWHSVSGNPTLGDLTDENGVPTTVDFSISGNNAVTGAPVPLGVIPMHSNPLDEIGGYANSDSITAVFSDLAITSSYDVWVFGWRAGADYQNAIDVIGASTISFTQFSSDFFVNDEAGASNRTLDSYALTLSPDALGQITFEIDRGPDFPVRIAALAIREVSSVAAPTTLALLGLGLAGIGYRRLK